MSTQDLFTWRASTGIIGSQDAFMFAYVYDMSGYRLCVNHMPPTCMVERQTESLERLHPFLFSPDNMAKNLVSNLIRKQKNFSKPTVYIE